MSKLRKHDHTMDGSDWDLSALSLNDCPVDELTRNPKAKRIDFSQNFFTKLPPSFTSLSHLTELDLSKNRLTQLPEDFGRLNKLVRLDLYDNRLKTLPLSFGQLFRLKWLDLKSNPLEPNLAKYAGDCANQKQCQTCALNCIKFMKYEKIRVDSEMRQKEEKLRQQIEFEDRMDVKNKKEREKKKLKNARRSARKAQQKTDDNEENDDNDTKDSDSDAKTNGNGSPRSTSFGQKVFNFVMFLIRLVLFLSSISLILLIGIAIGLHLQNGRKLESIEDIKTALSNSYKLAQNHQQFLKDTTLLIENIVKGLKNWRTTFKVFDEKPNVINK